MLGKLFSSAAAFTARGSSLNGRPTTTLESVQEDIHTRNLVFPDATALAKHHHDQVFPLSVDSHNAVAKAFDLAVEPDIDLKDVRIIIMQEATSFSQSATLLYDSCPPPKPTEAPPASNAAERRRSVTSPRKTSMTDARSVFAEINPRPLGAFDRKGSNLGRNFAETDGQRSAREYREETSTFSSCIFGSSDIMAYKGTGTKVHLISSQATTAPPSVDGHASLGRASMRSSKLAQSCTFDGVHSAAPAPARAVERKKALITRLFPVPLLFDEPEDAQPAHPKEDYGYPFPQMTESVEKKKPRQRRTPMYAVALIVQLPTHTVPPPRTGVRSGSFNEHESCPSSFNSSKWVLPSGSFGPESLESLYGGDYDDGMHVLTPHWDIIMRTLSHLQRLVSAEVLTLLRQADLASPEPSRDIGLRRPTGPKRHDDDARVYRPSKSNAKVVQLLPNALSNNARIKSEVPAAIQRIVTGIKAQQVIRGQGRWGIWREEARWVGRWAGGKEEGFFFFNLLTGFLGNHTEWLQALGPSWYRRRYHQQRAHRDDDIGVPARTVIISHDKMAARRLIFLLAAFLPASQHPAAFRSQRPYTSASFGGYSQSPPSFGREESLQRKMNRQSKKARASHTRTMSFPANTESHERRSFDPGSVKSANLPIPGSNGVTRKTSAAVTTTVTPITTIPHFATRPVRGRQRPGSSGSFATDDLLRSLKRGDSTGHFSTASTDSQSLWGSVISGLWSNKRRGSTNVTDATPPSESAVIDELSRSPRMGTSPTKSKLSQMVEEAQRIHRTNPPLTHINTKATDDDDTDHTTVSTERVTTPGIFEAAVKTSINSTDGTIDIEVPLPDFLSQSAISSPSSSGYLSINTGGFGIDSLDQSRGPELDPPLNVGGWMPRYHPDFALHAIPANDLDRDKLIEEVKNSLRAEPTPFPASTPSLDEAPKDRWVDVSSAIIADTTNFSIKRIRYRRLIKFKAHDELATQLHSGYGHPYSAPTPAENFSECDEKFLEEPIISMDETLIEAVERIIMQATPTADAAPQDDPTGSGSSSRSNSRQRTRERSDSDCLGNERRDVVSEIPRGECKKMVLGALEEIVRAVVETRREGDDASLGEGEERRESVLREGVRSWLLNVEEAY